MKSQSYYKMLYFFNFYMRIDITICWKWNGNECIILYRWEKNPPLYSNLISRYRQNGDKIRLGFHDIQIYFVKIYIMPGKL